MCCQRRPQLDSEDYWSGQNKVTSAYKQWAPGYPEYDRAACVRYTKDGLKDKPCSFKYYFACKKSAGV